MNATAWAGTSAGCSRKVPKNRTATELDGEAQPHVRAAAAGDEGAVGVVEAEVAGQLLGGGFSGIQAVAPLLILIQEGNGHRRFLAGRNGVSFAGQAGLSAALASSR